MLQEVNMLILLKILLHIFLKFLKRMSGDLKTRFNHMRIRNILSCYYIIYLLFHAGRNQGNITINSKPGKNEMADLNRYLVQKDRERIKNYIERKNLKMT